MFLDEPEVKRYHAVGMCLAIQPDIAQQVAVAYQAMTIAVFSLRNRRKDESGNRDFFPSLSRSRPVGSPRQPAQKINLKSWRIFRRSIWCRFQPHFHHKSTTIYHALHHVLRTGNRKTPLQKRLFTMPERITKYTAKDLGPSQ
jgi:hypothetical protein